MLEFYDNDMSVCAQKVRLVFAEKGIEYTRVPMDLRAGDQFRPDYLALNPKGVVPTIVHDGNVVIESTVIIAYLDEAFDGVSLTPSTALERARMLHWMILPDGGFHDVCGITSFALAFRMQLLQKTPEELEQYYANLKSPQRRVLIRAVVEQGIDAPVVAPALNTYFDVIGRMESALQSSDWLASGDCSLADVTMLPYTLRLEHLGLDFFWNDRPNVARWYERMKQRPSFEALRQYFNPNYLAIVGKTMAEQGDRVRSMVG